MKKIVTVVTGFMATLLTTSVVFAEEAAHAATVGDAGSALAIAAGLGIAIAAFGGALGQGKAAAAALEGIARNPDAAAKIQTPMIIALALIESLVIYALLIAFMLQGKIS